MLAGLFHHALGALVKGLLSQGPPRVCHGENLPAVAPLGTHPTYPVERHGHPELALLTAGRAAMIVEGRSWAMTAGTPLLLLPGTAHAESWVEPGTAYDLLWGTLGGTSLAFTISRYEPERGRRSLEGRVLVNTPPVQRLWALCLKAAPRRAPGALDLARLYALTLLVASDALETVETRGITAGEELSAQAVRLAQSYLETNYARPIAVADVARLLHLSPNYLNTRFRQATGTPLLRYLNKVRIDAARQLLRESSLPVKAVSREVGIADPLYFCRLFKAQTGVNPTAYRQARQD